jgi:hypothetical protein
MHDTKDEAIEEFLTGKQWVIAKRVLEPQFAGPPPEMAARQ